MGALFVYIFKSSLCLAGFYLFYRLLLSKETFHRFNRFALLSVCLISLAIPFYGIKTYRTAPVRQTIATLERADVSSSGHSREAAYLITPAEVPVAPRFPWQPFVFIVYISGIIFFLFRNIYSLVRLVALLLKGRRKKLPDGIMLVAHTRNLSPFSWMNRIFVSVGDLAENGREILMHEREHIRQYHSFDLLLAEFVILLQWFNPAAWLFKQLLQNLHEYQADEAVLRHGADARHYQLLLIKKAAGTVRFNSLANSFNHSSLKKRITMMSKRKSSPWARLKYLYVLPVATIAVTLFARPEVSGEFDRISALKVNDLVSEMKDNPEIINPGMRDSVVLGFSYIRSGTELPLENATGELDDRYLSVVETFLKDHPRCRIVADNVEVSPENFRADAYSIDFITTQIGKDAGPFGKRVQRDGLILVNTSEAFFKNVILKGGSMESAGKVLDRAGSAMILDGKKVANKSLEEIKDRIITSLKIDGSQVYVTTHTGEMIQQLISKGPEAFAVLTEKEVESDQFGLTGKKDSVVIATDALNIPVGNLKTISVSPVNKEAIYTITE